ncbi:hypothetical protein ACFX15_019427 [Malus domestica]|uniref:TMEM205-like domain-containing protein n=1 Tax=Malus domestica TaxID=3750 RepID=A0A498HTV6_MALDO|nr:hypothetical protein DVH24_016526 [Malus domestica]
MMNFVALFLVVSSLVTAGVWSPSASPPSDQTQQQKQREEGHQLRHAGDQEVIVKNGHRVVVVEYNEHGHHKTKVSISPEHGHPPRTESSSFSENEVSSPSKISRAFDNSMENIKEAASGLANFGQGHGEGHSPKELMCDACGKCKHNIASAIETKKEICKETAHGAKEAAHKVGEAAHRVREAVENVYERAKDTVSDKAHEVEETARDPMEKAKNASKTAKDMGDTLAEKAKEAKETAEEAAFKVKAGAEELKSDLAEKAKEAKETAEEAAGKVKAGAEELKSGTQKRLHQSRDKIREFWYGAFRSIASGDLLEGLMSVTHLFGLATAYGMCMWITFVSSHVLAWSLPPQQFGMVQSKIYKVYFKAMAYSVGMALLGHLWRHRSSLFRGKAADMLQNYNLIAALSMILFNMMYLEPRSTKVMFERMKIEKEEGRGRERVHIDARISREAGQQQQQQQTTTEGEPSITTPPQVLRREQQVVEPDIERLNEMRERLKKLNTCSSFLNIASLMALSWHLVYLAQHLPSSCC